MGGQVKRTAVNIQVRHHRTFLNLRNQERLIQDSFFVDAWNLANGEQQEEVCQYINQIQAKKVKNWISRILIKTLERCPVRILRQLASRHGVKNYSRLSKEELLQELSKKEIDDDSEIEPGKSKDPLGSFTTNPIIGGRARISN